MLHAKKVQPGGQLSARSYNNIRKAVMGIDTTKVTAESHTTPNPVIIRVKNTTNGTLNEFSVIGIKTPLYNRDSKADFNNAGTAYGVELKADKWDSDRDDHEVQCFGVTCKRTPKNGLVYAVVAGPTPVQITHYDEKYPYCIPVKNNTESVRAMPFGPAKIIWVDEGSSGGPRNGYINIGVENWDCYFKIDTVESTGGSEEGEELEGIACDKDGAQLGPDEIRRKLYAPLGSTITQGAIVFAHWFEGENKWLVVSSSAPLACIYENPNTESAPAAAAEVDSEKTFLSSDGDNFVVDGMAGIKLFNPLGLPDKRPAIVATVTGFPGEEEEETGSSGGSSSGGSSESDSETTYLTAVGVDVRELIYFGESTGGGTGAAGIEAGDLYYVEWSESNRRWEPMNGAGAGSGSAGSGGSESGGSTGSTGSGGGEAVDGILAVCQKDVPNDWTGEYYMPFYTPEQNYGKYPKRGSAAGERCGVVLEEKEFSNKRLDYLYKNHRYAYEPIFTYKADAEAGDGTDTVKITIEDQDVEVTFNTPDNALLQPDIYAGDKITVRVDASGNTPEGVAIDYPVDYKKDTILFMPSTSPMGRGWEDITADFMEENCVGDKDLWVFYHNQQGLEHTSDVATYGKHWDPKDYYVPEHRTEETGLSVGVWPMEGITALEGNITPNPHGHDVAEVTLLRDSDTLPAHEKLELHDAPIKVWKKTKDEALL